MIFGAGEAVVMIVAVRRRRVARVLRSTSCIFEQVRLILKRFAGGATRQSGVYIYAFFGRHGEREYQ